MYRDIIPDEPYHFQVAQYFSETWGIPFDVPVAINLGTNLQRTPFLAYWAYGRALNVLELINSDPSSWQQLVFLRIFNTILSIGTVGFTYLISKELIKNKWWQLLPVFVLTNTLMFVFLSSGVNYDNLANLFSTAGIFYLLRVLKNKAFLSNSLSWIIWISLGTLVKEPILPLALVMGVVWLIYIYKTRPLMKLEQAKRFKLIGLCLLVVILITANLWVYGVNLIRYQSLTPSCRDYFTNEHCANTGFALRREELALAEKPNVIQAFQQGYPEPLRYFFDTWIRAMLMKIFGIMGGQKSYYPIGIAYYHILLYWMMALSIRYYKKLSFELYGLLAIIGFYAMTLFIKNYDTDLAYGFIQVAHQGRYIFPVISPIYALFSYVLVKVPRKFFQLTTTAATVLLFLYGGPIRFFLYYNTVFTDWFI